MKRFLLSVILLGVLLPGFASDDEVRLAEAERLYREGMDLLATDFSQAASLLEQSEGLYRTLAEKYPNASVYVCLGNSAFFRKKFPLAVYYYREAQSFRNSAEIRSGLNAARLRLNEQIEIPLRVRIFEGVFFGHFWIPFSVRLLTLYLFFAGLSFFGAFFVYRKGAVRGGKTILTVCGILFVCNFVSVGITAVEKIKWQEGVLLQETEGRSGDHPAYEEAYRRMIPAGSEITVLKRRPGWLYVRLRDRSKCWIPEGAVSVIGETP